MRVVDGCGVDVLERARVGVDVGDVHFVFVCERVAVDVGLVWVGLEVEQVGD